MKKHMMPKTAQMFSECVHPVEIRKDAEPRAVYKWLCNNIVPAENGFRPWIRVGTTLKFKYERDAVLTALKWT